MRIQTLGHRLSIRAGTSRQIVFMGENTPTVLYFPGFIILSSVNLGGWFVLEPFITPALFQKYPTAIDEWTFSTAMAADGGLSQLEEHYKTFIVSARASRLIIVDEIPVQTEDDIAEIAGAGLNWVRIPIPYWAIDVWNNEPFLARTSWK